MNLERDRQEINKIDQELLQILNRRAQLALSIGEHKKKDNQPIFDPEREQWILEQLTQKNPGPLSNGAITRIFQALIQENRNLEIEHQNL
jgi:chorismate mutase-like protein